jgi:hypothetical protein
MHFLLIPNLCCVFPGEPYFVEVVFYNILGVMPSGTTLLQNGKTRECLPLLDISWCFQRSRCLHTTIVVAIFLSYLGTISPYSMDYSLIHYFLEH